MSPAIGQLQKRLSYTYDKQYYVPRITVISLEIVHEGLRRHVEDALLLPLQESEKEGIGYRPLILTAFARCNLGFCPVSSAA